MRNEEHNKHNLDESGLPKNYWGLIRCFARAKWPEVINEIKMKDPARLTAIKIFAETLAEDEEMRFPWRQKRDVQGSIQESEMFKFMDSWKDAKRVICIIESISDKKSEAPNCLPKSTFLAHVKTNSDPNPCLTRAIMVYKLLEHIVGTNEWSYKKDKNGPILITAIVTAIGFEEFSIPNITNWITAGQKKNLHKTKEAYEFEPPIKYDKKSRTASIIDESLLQKMKEYKFIYGHAICKFEEIIQDKEKIKNIKSAIDEHIIV